MNLMAIAGLIGSILLLHPAFTPGRQVVTRKRFAAQPDVRPIGAAYFRTLPDVIPYEATAKLLFTINLPNLEGFQATVQSKVTYQMIQNTTASVKQDFQDYLDRYDQKKRREKRQVAVAAALIGGFVINSVYTRISNKLNGSDKEALDYVQQIQNDLRAKDRDFMFFKSDVNEFAKRMGVTVNKFYRQMEDTEHIDVALLHLSQVQIAISKVEDGLERCINHLLPVQIIANAELKDQLLLLQSTLHHKGYLLAIDIHNLHEFEKLKIVDCFVSPKKVYVLLNVPVRRSEWIIKQMLPIPFSFGSQTCSLNPPNTEIVAVNRDDVRVIDSYMQRYCDVVHDKLCLIPQFAHPFSNSAACTQSLFHGKSINDLSSLCMFQCNNSTELVTIQVEEAKLIAVNARDVTAECPNQYHDYSVKKLGSVEIALKCECKYAVGQLRLENSTICLNDQFQQSDIVHLVPNFLNLTYDVHFNDSSPVWPKGLPMHNLAVDVHNHETMPVGNLLPYHDYWLMAHSAILLVVLIVIVMAYCYFRNLK